MFAGVELGGTKIVCAAGTDPRAPTRRVAFPTAAPAQALPAIIEFLRGLGPSLCAVGIGGFGPLLLEPGAARHGQIVATPKPGWSGVNPRAEIARALGVPVAIDTDVNAAGLAEARFGAGQGLGSLAYVTVGTGLGGGLILDGRALHGRAHPEIGHIRLRRHQQDSFAGCCPIHGDCAEGLAAGLAVAQRWGANLASLPSGHPGHAMEAWYLGELCAALVLAWAPHRIVLGGGVPTHNPGLFGPIRAAAGAALAGYLPDLAEPAALAALIVAPDLGEQAGVCGALLLAEMAAG